MLSGLVVLIAVCAAALWYMTAMPGPRHTDFIPSDTDNPTANHLRAHVEALATHIGPRSIEDTDALRKTVDYIEHEFVALGYHPHRQRIDSDDFGFPNLWIEIPGSVSSAPLVLVGAHYDTVEFSPGADDNASAVAVLLELARLLKGRTLACPLRLVAFADEERGFGGSRFCASDLHAHATIVKAMLSLEMLGYYNDSDGSQRYPLNFLLRHFYPQRGNFIGFVGNLASRDLVRTCVKTFRHSVRFPCEGLAAPELVRDIGRSDNVAFWLEGYKAAMVTDTSNYRNPFYHQFSDVANTLDYRRMARVTQGLLAVVESLTAYP